MSHLRATHNWFGCTARLPTICWAVALVLVVRCSTWASDRVITYEEFSSLSDEERRAFLVDLYRARNEATRNVVASSRTTAYNTIVKNNKPNPGLSRKDSRFWDCELRRIGRDYRAEQSYMDPGREGAVISHAASQNISTDGINRILAKHEAFAESFGAIESRHDPMVQSGKFNYWFDLDFDKEAEFPIAFLLKNANLIEFVNLDSEHRQVQISLKKDNVQALTGKVVSRDLREVTLDASKGFLPVAIHRIVDVPNHPQNPVFNQFLFVDEFQEIDGIWFPFKFFSVGYQIGVSVDPLKEYEASIFETEVSKVELGKLQPMDLVVEFPPGTKVHDRIKGEWSIDGVPFLLGSEGKEPVEVRKPIIPAKSTTIWNKWIFVGANTTLVILGIFVFSKGYRKGNPEG